MIESTVVPIPDWQSKTSHESICRAVYPPSLGTQSFYIEPRSTIDHEKDLKTVEIPTSEVFNFTCFWEILDFQP